MTWRTATESEAKGLSITPLSKVRVIDWREAAITALELNNKPRTYECDGEHYGGPFDGYTADDLYWNGKSFVCMECCDSQLDGKPTLEFVLQAATPRMT